MAVTVRDILNLPSFKNVSILAGEDGLNNIVSQVSIADSPISNVDYLVAKEGDFYLSEFYFAKDSVEDMYSYLNTIINTKGSGICLLDEYIQELPPEIIEHCNNKHLPVFLISVDVPYGLMIKEIMELIIADGQNMLLEKEITSIIEGTIDEKSKLQILNHLNPHFQNNIITFYIFFNGNAESTITEVCNIFNRNVLSSGILYRKGVLGLITCSESAQEQINATTQYYIDKLSHFKNIASIGISDTDNKLKDAAKAIKQSLTAAEIGLRNSENESIVKYHDLGIIRLLMLLSGQLELEEFSNNIIGALMDYDKTTNSQIYNTMYTFHKNGYHYKNTAKALFVHENTVRYRIDKAKEIICSKSAADDFRETFSIAIKCKNIIENYK
ncbi:MAG: PucR family transcriptional regulator ligand-binding domain-containing protein [Lachnospiraceae bacterium]|nr:PucR family transcriptional regulator ligand-binding domain-containing protein [Lachnospiraceae bacterium]